MRKLLLFGIFLLFSSCLQAQIYTAGSSENPQVSLPRWEFSGAWVGDFSRLEDRAHYEMANHQTGWNARLLYYLSSSWAIGVEGTWFGSERFSRVSQYEVRQWGALVKWVPAQESFLRSYLALGGGIRSFELDYTFRWKEKDASPFYWVGLGMDVYVCTSIFVGAEARIKYHAELETGAFYHLDSHWEPEVSFRAGIRF